MFELFANKIKIVRNQRYKSVAFYHFSKLASQELVEVESYAVYAGLWSEWFSPIKTTFRGQKSR